MVDIVTPQPKLQCKCKNCKAGLAYVKTEVQNRTYRDYGGDSNITHFIICPSCSKEVEVSSSFYF